MPQALAFIRIKKNIININSITHIENMENGIKIVFLNGSFVGIPEPEASVLVSKLGDYFAIDIP